MGTIAKAYESIEQSALKSQFFNLLMIARIDGEINSSEQVLLDKLSDRLSLSKDDISKIIENEDKYPFIAPISKEDRIDRFVQLIDMMIQDGKVAESEERLVFKYGIGLGFDNESVKHYYSKILSLLVSGKEIDQIVFELMK
jgi:hypothetical protein